MKRLFIIFSLLLGTTMTYAQDLEQEEQTYVNKEKHGVFQGYSGGMMLHAGYQFGQGVGFQSENGTERDLRSLNYGIGGALRFHLFSHLRVGAEGYVSTMPLKSQGEGSNIRTGWGGVLADAYTKWGCVWPFIGGTIGGGAQRCTHVLSGEDNSIIGSNIKETWDNFKDYANSESTYPAEYTKRGFFAFDPFIGIEYAMTQKMHIVVKADYLICVHQKHFLTPSGPRLYVGFMFTH